MSDPKPCQFCGGEVDMNGTVENDFVECQSCAAGGPVKTIRELAMVAWNERDESALSASTAEVERLRKQMDALVAGLRAVEALICASRGVAGLHLNGDEATWAELRTGERFEAWLIEFDAALRLTPNGVEEVK